MENTDSGSNTATLQHTGHSGSLETEYSTLLSRARQINRSFSQKHGQKNTKHVAPASAARPNANIRCTLVELGRRERVDHASCLQSCLRNEGVQNRFHGGATPVAISP